MTLLGLAFYAVEHSVFSLAVGVAHGRLTAPMHGACVGLRGCLSTRTVFEQPVTRLIH